MLILYGLETILSYHLQEINEEWLSDKSRFAYDGLKRQRLVTPMIKDERGQLVASDWEEALFNVVGAVSSTFVPVFYDAY